MFLRRSAAALAASAVLCAVAAPAALADESPSPSPKDPSSGAGKLPDGRGLYGKADPKFDGVWRQSVALLALDAAGATPAPEAVDWLTGQQCADGSFTAYRADTGQACDPKKTPGDTNATGVAVQALSAVGGRSAAVKKAVDWLESAQNEDGGWGYTSGSPSDANSVSVVIGALAAAGRDPGKTAKGGKTPYDALLSFQLDCDAKGAEDAKKGQFGAFAYQPGKDGTLAPNDDATAAAALAGLGEGLLVHAKDEGPALAPLSCAKDGDGDGGIGDDPEKAAGAGAAYLASVLERNGGHLDSVMPGAEGQPDYANTADAVVALAAGGHRDEAKKPLGWLRENLSKWDKADDDPAAIGGLMLAVHATGGDAATLGGTDLLKRLNATGPRPAKMPDASDSAKSDEGEGDGGGTVLFWSMIGAGLAAGAGIGIMLSGRRKRQGV
ncbi:prenyltransferase/squalene oxidase repeat-containing protein [Streptomyces sp. NPDC054796]